MLQTFFATFNGYEKISSKSGVQQDDPMSLFVFFFLSATLNSLASFQGQRMLSG